MNHAAYNIMQFFFSIYIIFLFIKYSNLNYPISSHNNNQKRKLNSSVSEPHVNYKFLQLAGCKLDYTVKPYQMTMPLM